MRRLLASVLFSGAALAGAPAALAAGDRPDVAGYPTPSTASVQPAGDAWATPSATLVGGPGDADAPCGPCRLATDACGNPRWSFDLWVGGWLWAQTGTVGAGDREVDIDTDLSDSIDLVQEHGESAITGGFRLGYGRCFLAAWLSYVHVSGANDNLPTGEPLVAEYKGLTAQITAGYRVTETSLGCGPCAPCLAIEPFAGVRYNGMKVTIEGAILDVERDRDWWDPIVGAVATVDFRNGWWATAAADVGGFGVESDLTWSVRAEVGRHLNDHVGLFLGLAAISWDYDADEFRFDLVQWGPYFGVRFSF